MFLNNYPLCAMCEKAGRVTPATVVDHLEEVATHPEKRLEWDNLQALCAPCHNSKTARTRPWGERGG